jgi:hypothetical protein
VLSQIVSTGVSYYMVLKFGATMVLQYLAKDSRAFAIRRNRSCHRFNAVEVIQSEAEVHHWSLSLEGVLATGNP